MLTADRWMTNFQLAEYPIMSEVHALLAPEAVSIRAHPHKPTVEAPLHSRWRGCAGEKAAVPRLPGDWATGRQYAGRSRVRTQRQTQMQAAEAELSAADLALLGRICDELRHEEQAPATDGKDATADTEAEAERRREKNRLKVRRHYHRRLRLMSDLRRQVALLETQLQHLQRHQAVVHSGALTAAAAADWPARLAALAELERTRAQLEREHRALRHCVAFHAARAASRPPPAAAAPLRRPPALLLLRPVGPREVSALREHMLAQAAVFAAAAGGFSRLGSVRGWEAARAVDAGLFKFLLRRPHIREARPEALLRATWALLSHGDRFRALFSDRLGVACHVLQPVDGDTALALLQYSGRRVAAGVATGAPQEMETETERALDDDLDVKTLYALAKFAGPRDAHTIVLRGVARRPLLLPSAALLGGRTPDKQHEHESGEWTDLFVWLRLERTPDGSALTFGGAVPTLDARSPFWLAELLLVALRWERAVLG